MSSLTQRKCCFQMPLLYSLIRLGHASDPRTLGQEAAIITPIDVFCETVTRKSVLVCVVHVSTLIDYYQVKGSTRK